LPQRVRRSHKAAFTLIEILIVVSLLAILVTTGVPAIFRALKQDPMRQAVTDLVEACSFARAHAILGGVSMEMVIAADGGAIRVERAREKQPAIGRELAVAQPTAVPSRSQFLRPMHLHEDVAVELLYVNLRDQMHEAQARVRFYPNGTSDEFAVVLRHDEKVRKIELDIITGLADVQSIR
jgi:prepilin-type N-terminal cleavage/methylation domain-containing protein